MGTYEEERHLVRFIYHHNLLETANRIAGSSLSNYFLESLGKAAIAMFSDANIGLDYAILRLRNDKIENGL